MKLLIFTCSNYSDLWKNHMILMEKYWSNHPDYLFCSDGYSKYDFNPEKIFVSNSDMTGRMIDCLETLDDEYILFTLDDYFVKKPVNVSKLNMILNYVKNNKIDYCRIFDQPKVKGTPTTLKKVINLPLTKTYEVNFYPGIWRRESLLKILKRNENIWVCEARLTSRFRKLNFKGIQIDNAKLLEFEDIIRKGKYLRKAYRFLKREGLYISERPKRTIKETIYLDIQTFVSRFFPSKIKNVIKNKLRKKGRVFYSDYADTEE